MINFSGVYSGPNEDSLITGKEYQFKVDPKNLIKPDIEKPGPHINVICEGLVLTMPVWVNAVIKDTHWGCRRYTKFQDFEKEWSNVKQIL